MAKANLQVEVTGLRQTMKALENLSDSMRADALKGAIEKASEPVVRSAKGRAPSAVIARGIRVVNVIVKNDGEIKSEIGLPGGRKPWFHGLFVELGTGPRIQKTTGRRTGSMPADPFLRPAFDSERSNVRRVFARELKVLLKAAALKSARITGG